MKYLKTFENNPKDKDYVVSYSKPFYYIDQINIFNNYIKLNSIASLDEEEEEIKKHAFKDTTTVNLSYLNKILYSSKDLEDCYDFLKAFIKSKKYNL